jgi:hypothetical protein
MIKKRLIVPGMAILALLLPLLVGCGQIDVNLHTTIKSSGDLVQEVRFTGSGMMAGFLDDAEATGDLEMEGWEVTIERSASSSTLIASREFSLNEVLAIPDLSDDPDALENYDFRVRNYFFFTDYIFKVTLPGNPVEVPTDDLTGLDGFDDDIISQLLEGLFSMSWAITLPGEITESNADSTQDSTATWVFDIGSLDQDQEIAVRSRLVNWSFIAGTAAGLAVLAGAVVFLVIRKRAAQVSN